VVDLPETANFTLQQPKTERDLPRPFESIGDAGWAEAAREVLNAYGVPDPVPVAADVIVETERRLGCGLPEKYRRLLMELGPIDADAFRFLAPHEVVVLDKYWARASFGERDTAALGKMVSIVDYCSTGDPIGLDLETGHCARCGHDPPGLSNWLPSVDSLVLVAFLCLPVGYYGWQDTELEALVAREQERLFGTRL